MAEILQTENPFLPGQPISDDINITHLIGQHIITFQQIKTIDK